MPNTRRSFLESAAAFSLAPLTGPEATLILHNGHIVTMDPGQPAAQAMAIADGRFLAVGSSADVLNLATVRTKRIDLGGRTVVPGFIDAHTHPAYSGYRHLKQVDCDLRSIAAIQDALRTRAGRTTAGEWVIGFKYDDTKTADGRGLTRDDLDAVSREHPVVVEHRGGHTAYLNSAAFTKAGIAETTPDPAGGRFDRDPRTGRLTGRAAEKAKDLIDARVPATLTRAERREGVALISKMMSRAGITSATDAGGSPEDLQAYQDARAAGDLSIRIYCHISAPYLHQMLAAGVRSGLGDEWVRVGAVKLICDGSISERTARLSKPYIGRPDDRGILVNSEEEIHAIAAKAHEADWQIGVHANGDEAIDITLRVFERLQKERPRRDPRFRIEHCTLINADLVRRIKAIGAIPTPFSTYAYYHGEKMREYGSERLNSMFALRSFLDAGIRATQASDYPPGPFEPMMALQSEVTRTDLLGNTWGPEQRITVEEALRVGTMNGAYASFEERQKGSIEAGKLADLVVLGRDPLREPPASLVTIPVERTMAGGAWVYEA